MSDASAPAMRSALQRLQRENDELTAKVRHLEAALAGARAELNILRIPEEAKKIQRKPPYTRPPEDEE